LTRRATTRRTVVLDAEALSRLAAGDPAARDFLAAARVEDAEVVVPSVVLAELMTGGRRDAALWHVMRRLPAIDLTAKLAARAGALRQNAAGARAKKRDLAVDAMVVAVAESVQPATVLTGDPGDLALMADGLDVRVVAVNEF
jgi:predicted nucleic acid-binding protein